MSSIVFNSYFNKSRFNPDLNSLLKLSINESFFEESIFILPTGRAQKVYEDNFTKYYNEIKSQPAPKILINTFEQFLWNNYKTLNNSNKQLIDIKYAVMLVEEICKSSNLNYFVRSNKISPSLLQNISQLIMKLDKEGIGVKEIKDELDSNETDIYDKRKLNDIAIIYEGFNKLLEENNLITYSTMIDEIIDSNSFIDLINSKSFYFFFFTDFNIPELKLLSHFSQNEIPISLSLDFSEDYGPTFINLRNSLKSLLSDDFYYEDLAPLSKEISNKSNISPKNYIRKFLFRDQISNSFERKLISSHKLEYLKDSFKFISSENKVSSYQSLINLILDLNINKNIPLNDIVICSRQSSEFSQDLKIAFEDARIPINISDRYSLINSNPAQFILDYINIFSNGFNSEDIIKFINNPMFKLNEYSHKSIHDFISIINKKRIFKLNDIEFLSNSKDKDLNKLFEFLKPLYNKFKFCSLDHKNISIKEFNKKLKIFINEFDLINTISEFKNSLDVKLDNFKLKREIEVNSKALATIIDLTNELEYIISSFSSLNKFSLNDIKFRFTHLIENSRFHVRELYDHGITFTSIEQTRGMNKKVSILLGANESLFPLNYKTDSLMGKDLTNSFSKHYNSERHLFYQFLNSSNIDKGFNSHYFFYLKKEANIDLIPSSFLNSLIDLFSYEKLEDISDDNYEFQTNSVKDLGNYQFPDEKQFIMRNELLDLSSNNLNKTLSASSINTYISDPYLFFIQRVLNISQNDILDENISNMEKGTIYHNVISSFFNFLLDNNIDVITTPKYHIKSVNLQLTNRSKYVSILNSIIDNVLASWDINDKYYDLFVNRLKGKENDIGLFYNWLDFEIEKSESEDWPYKPTFFEKHFKLELDFKLQGQIDLIELCEIDDQVYISVCDYKSSSSFATVKEVENFEDVQLPIYLLAAKSLLKNEYSIEANIGFAYYQTISFTQNSKYFTPIIYSDKYLNSTIFGRRLNNKLSQNDIQNYLNELVKKLEDISNEISKGNFYQDTIDEKPFKIKEERLFRD